MGWLSGEAADPRLTQERAPEKLYGLLADLERPARGREGDEDMRCRPRSSLSRPRFLIWASDPMPFPAAPSTGMTPSGAAEIGGVAAPWGVVIPASAILVTVSGAVLFIEGLQVPETRTRKGKLVVGNLRQVWGGGGEESTQQGKTKWLGESSTRSNCGSGLAVGEVAMLRGDQG